jgi:hypothetical protein
MPSTKPGLHRSREPQPAPATPEQRVAAVRAVAAHARDADDCRALLTMLGLDPHRPRHEKGADGERAPTRRPHGNEPLQDRSAPF